MKEGKSTEGGGGGKECLVANKEREGVWKCDGTEERRKKEKKKR